MSKWGSRPLILVMVIASACVGPNYAKRGDSAAATGDWKAAVDSYTKALSGTPNSPELRKKYDDARTHAIAQALAIAKRCHTDHDLACVDREATYVLSLDAANADAGSLRSGAHKEQALSAIASAREQAKQGEFLVAVRGLAAARALSSDDDVLVAAKSAGEEMARPAVSYVETRLQQPPADLEEQVKVYGECIEILHEVVAYVPERADLLGQTKARYDATSAELDRRKQAQLAAQEAAQQEVERQRQAQEARDRADSSRTVSVVGALVAPGKEDGTQWDGMGSKVDAQLARGVVEALAESNPYTAVLGIMAGPAANALEKPDVGGSAQLYLNGQPMGDAILLEKNQDAFTPQWSNAGWTNVDIHRASLRIELIERDIANDDPMGIIVIDAKHLEAAVDAGGVTPIPVSDQTNGQVLFLNISVM